MVGERMREIDEKCVESFINNEVETLNAMCKKYGEQEGFKTLFVSFFSKMTSVVHI